MIRVCCKCKLSREMPQNRWMCDGCWSTYQKNWRANHKEQRRQHERDLYRKNPKQFHEKQRRYRANHPEVNWTPGARYSQLKHTAKRLDVPFDITKEKHAKLLAMPCEYCGGALNPTGHALDRKDPARGYVLDNVVPCCWSCNQIKCHLLTYDEMKAAMAAVVALRRQIG